MEPSHLKSQNLKPYGLRYAASAGLLPGVGVRNANWAIPGLSISYESEISKDKDMGGTSPVTSACVAAAMTANIPMAVAFTLRQISDEKRQSIKRKKTLSFSGLEWSPSQESEKSSKSVSPKPFVHDTSADSVVPGSQSDSLSFELPKPTWPRDKKIRTKRNPTSANNHYMIPSTTSKDGIEAKNDQSTSANSSFVPNPSTLHPSETSDLDNSAPSSPLSSSHTSIASSLSDTSVSIKTTASDRDSQDFALSKAAASPLNDSSSMEKQHESGLVSKEPSSLRFSRLKNETDEPGTYNTNFAKMYLHYSPITEPCSIVTVAEVHKSSLKRDVTDTNHNSSRSHSSLLTSEKRSDLKENRIQEKFNDITNDNDDDNDAKLVENLAPYLNGHTNHWLREVNSVHEIMEETQV